MTTLKLPKLSAIQDEKAREGFMLLLNLVEELKAENQQLRETVQKLKNENARLKGEQGQPPVKPPPPPKNYSSEKERSEKKQRRKRSKRNTIRIDREEVLRVERAELPTDAEFKGYDEVVVQDLVVRTDNVLFRKEIFHSASEGKTYRAEMPPGYQGSFGPGVRALVIALYYGGQMSGPKTLEFLHSFGIEMSSGTLSNFLNKNQDDFHAEKDAVYQAGLNSSPWQHIDDTGTRVKGEARYCHIVCNPLYTVYHTLPSKDRLTIIDVLCNQRERVFRLNDEALVYLERMRFSAVNRQRLQRLPRDENLTAEALDRLLNEHLPDLGPQQHKWVLDALAVAAYHHQTEWPVIDLLIADDAAQFKWVTEKLALCWVHEGRHYKKLTPFIPRHRWLLNRFLKQFWDFYRDLQAYRRTPTADERTRLTERFDQLFSTVTYYDLLDERIAKTRNKKDALLLVLDYPDIPLHNNPAELGARARVRKRLVSFGPASPDGVQAWDTFMSLAATTQKLGISFYHYTLDRISQAQQIPSLASLITQRASELNLASSWPPS